MNLEVIKLIVEILMMIATFMASFIALYQTRIANSKRLKLSISIKEPIVNYNNESTLISLTVSNIGNRNIIINSWGIKHRYNKISQIINNQFNERELPFTLKIDETVDFNYPILLIIQSLADLLNKGKVSENDKMIFFIKDSNGKIYTVKMNVKIKTLLQDYGFVKQ